MFNLRSTFTTMWAFFQTSHVLSMSCNHPHRLLPRDFAVCNEYGVMWNGLPASLRTGSVNSRIYFSNSFLSSHYLATENFLPNYIPCWLGFPKEQLTLWDSPLRGVVPRVACRIRFQWKGIRKKWYVFWTILFRTKVTNIPTDHWPGHLASSYSWFSCTVAALRRPM